MDSHVQLFLAKNLEYFPKSKQPLILEKISQLDEHKKLLLHGIRVKKPVNWLLLYLFMPLFWILDRLFLGDWAMGVVKLFYFLTLLVFVLTVGDGSPERTTILMLGGLPLGFIWLLYDLFTIKGRTRTSNYELFMKLTK